MCSFVFFFVTFFLGDKGQPFLRNRNVILSTVSWMNNITKRRESFCFWPNSAFSFFFVNFFKKTRRETDFHLKVYIKQLNRSQNKHSQSTRQFESPLLLQVYCWCPFTQPRVYHDSLNNNSWTFIDFFFHVIQHPTCVTFLIAEQHTHTHTHDGQILKTLTAAQYKQKWGLAKELDDRAKSKWISIHHVNFYLSLCWR